MHDGALILFSMVGALCEAEELSGVKRSNLYMERGSEIERKTLRERESHGVREEGFSEKLTDVDLWSMARTQQDTDNRRNAGPLEWHGDNRNSKCVCVRERERECVAMGTRPQKASVRAEPHTVLGAGGLGQG